MEPKEPKPFAVLASTSLAVFAVFLDTTILFVAFPSIRSAFSGVQPSSLSWVLNAYTIVFAALLIPAGRLADRVGRRKTFLGAVVLFTVASMLCGLAPNVGLLVAARVLQAVGAAALVPSSLAMVLQTFPREKVPFAVAIWGAIGAVAGAAGPTLGALIVQNFSWRWAFFVNLPVGIVSLTLGSRVLPASRANRTGPIPDLSSVGLLAGGLALLAYGIVKQHDWGWGGGLLGVLSAATVLLVTFVRRSVRVHNPLVEPRLFSDPAFRWGNVAMLAFAIGFNAMFLGNVLFLTQVWQYSILRAGLVISVGPLIVAATAPFLGRLAGRVGQRRLLIPGGLIWAIGGALLISRATVTPHYLSQYLPAIVVTALGVAFVLPQLSSAAVQGLPADQFGTGSAVTQAVRNLGATLGVALAVAFTAGVSRGSALAAFHRVWYLLVASGISVSLLALLLPPRRSPAPVVVPVPVVVRA
jgi:EmrB/QacA subfamily drug resistance transporter